MVLVILGGYNILDGLVVVSIEACKELRLCGAPEK
jgi:hypothetical protein